MISAVASSSPPVQSETSYWRELVDSTLSYIVWGLLAFAVSMLAYAFDLGFKSILTHVNLGIEIVAALVALKVVSGIYADVQSIRRRVGTSSTKGRTTNIVVEIAMSLAMAVLSPKFVDLLRARHRQK